MNRIVGVRIADREADLAVGGLANVADVEAVAVRVRVGGGAQRAALPAATDRDHRLVVVQRAHGAHVHRARQALAHQAGVRGLVDGHAGHQLRWVLVELDAAVVAGADQLAAIEERGGEVRRQAAHADDLRATRHALRGDAGQARNRFGDAGIRQLADVLGGNRLDDRGRFLLDVDGALDAAADAGHHDGVEVLRIVLLLRRRFLLGLVGRRRGLRMRLGYQHHRRRGQRHAQQVSLQLHHLPLQE